MPTTPKGNRKGPVNEPERNRKGRLLMKEKSSSFHGRSQENSMEAAGPRIRRPSTLPDLLGGRTSTGFSDALPAVSRPGKMTKLLFNVTVQGSVGAVQVLTSPDSTVGELIAAVLRQYVREGRRPIVESDPGKFGIHYSQFSLESLEVEEKLFTLGSRNFFLCPKKEVKRDVGVKGEVGLKAKSSSCSKEAGKETRNAFAWLKFMDFLK